MIVQAAGGECQVLVASHLDQERGAPIEELGRGPLGFGQPALHQVESNRRDLHAQALLGNPSADLAGE